jgi:predicted RNA binding protein YcfA (HicA-like mRNA interferase family)
MAMLTDSRKIIQRLKRDSFELLRVTGSHHQFIHPKSRRRVTVVHPKKDLPLKTVRSIYEQAGWARD